MAKNSIILDKILFEAPVPIWELNENFEVLESNLLAQNIYSKLCTRGAFKDILSPQNIESILVQLEQSGEASNFEVLESNLLAQNIYSKLCTRGAFKDILSPQNIESILVQLEQSGEASKPYPKLGSEQNEFQFRLGKDKHVLVYLISKEITAISDISTYSVSRLLRNTTETDQLRINAVTQHRLLISAELLSEIFEQIPKDNTELRKNLDKLNTEFVRIERDLKNLDIITNYDKNAPLSTTSMNIWENMEYLLICVKSFLTSRGYKFKFSLPLESSYTYGSLNSIDTAILNIIENAYFHNSDDVEVEVIGENLENSVTITIKNNGNVNNCENPFSPFNAAGDTRDTVLGIGLTAAKAQIESLGGTILTSSSQHETVFKISLPCCKSNYGNNRVRSYSMNRYIENVRSPLYIAFSSFITAPTPNGENYF